MSIKHYTHSQPTKIRASGKFNGRLWIEDAKGYPTFRDNGQPVHNFVWMTSEDGREFGPIPYGWDIHHCDGNPLNFDIQNLVPLPSPYHHLIHARAVTAKKQYGGSQSSHLPARESLLAFARDALTAQVDLDLEMNSLVSKYNELTSKYASMHLKPPALHTKSKKCRTHKTKQQAKSAISQQDKQKSLKRFTEMFGKEH